jgi:hypothetical protein
MPIISWGLSRYPYYDGASFCNILCEHLSVLFCCQADFSDDEDDDDYDGDSTASSSNDYVRGASKID